MRSERTLVDAAGVEWRVFEEATGGPGMETGSSAGAPASKPEQCLVFEARNERRFISPAPVGWHSAPDEQIASLCERAETEDVGTQDDLERPT